MNTAQILGLVDEFKAFVFDSLEEGYHEDFEDPFVFLELALATFSDKMSEEHT